MAFLHNRTIHAEFKTGELDAGRQGKKLRPRSDLGEVFYDPLKSSPRLRFSFWDECPSPSADDDRLGETAVRLPLVRATPGREPAPGVVSV